MTAKPRRIGPRIAKYGVQLAGAGMTIGQDAQNTALLAPGTPHGGRAVSESTRTDSAIPEPSVASTEVLGPVWRFSTPYPPSTNALYATVQGRRVKTKAARDFADVVGDMASIMAHYRGIPDPPYRLTIDLWAPDARRRDADNGVKCLQDALLKATDHDDAEVVVLHVVKRGIDRIRPRADVTLEHTDA